MSVTVTYGEQFFEKFYYWTQPNPTYGWTLPMYIGVILVVMLYTIDQQ